MKVRKVNHGRIKPKPLKFPKHVARVRALPCLVCGTYSTAHHVTGLADRPGRIARSDRLVVPLCRAHHQIQHGPHFSVEALNHRGFFRAHGIDLWVEAKRLERESVAMGILTDG